MTTGFAKANGLSILTLLLFITSIASSLQIPRHSIRDELTGRTPHYTLSSDVEKRAGVPSFTARILSLGASIVYGYNTVDGNR
jgi:hypothetical protein